VSDHQTTPEPQVIVVDDDAAVCVALALRLELHGFRVQTCGTGEELLRMTLPARDACLVIDQRLPGISGVAALMRLRRRGVTLPAALITSTPTHQLRTAAASAQAPIIEKPLMDETLKAWITGALAA
jgi:FixJ family two-component response regulator